MKSLRFLPILALAAHALADATPAPEDHYDKALQVELRAIRKSDQSVRDAFAAASKGRSWNSPEITPARDAMLKTDAVNISKVTALLDQHGWIGPETVGPEASDTLFLVIQHADPLTQQKYLPLLRQAVQQGKAKAADLAFLEDRVALAEGHRQIYGSQLIMASRDGKLHVQPIEDPAHVDERRAAVGLPPMAEYLKRMNLLWDVENHQREIPWLELTQSDIVPTPEKREPALQAELLAILDADQRGRQRLEGIEKQYGRGSAELAALWKEITDTDAANLQRITALLDTRGWIGPDVVGSQATSALFLVIQHADLPVQQKYLPVLRAAAAERKLRPSELALLEDRIAMREGHPQIYGSQLRTDKGGKYVVAPLIDPEHVDERRATVGLQPIAEYLKHWNLTWDAKAFAAAQAAAK
jgi:hypothetical protein